MAKDSKIIVYSFKDAAELSKMLAAGIAILKLGGQTITKSELLRRLVRKGLIDVTKINEG